MTNLVLLAAMLALPLVPLSSRPQGEERAVMSAIAGYLRPQFKGRRVGVDPHFSDHGPRRDLKAGAMDAATLGDLVAGLPAAAVERDVAIRCTGQTRSSCGLVGLDVLMVFSRPVVERNRAVVYWNTDSATSSTLNPLEGIQREIRLERIRGKWLVRSVQDVAWS